MGTPNPQLDAVFGWIFPPFFVSLWIGIGFYIRSQMGFTWESSSKYMGAVEIDRVSFASARIGSVNCASSLTIIRLENGFLFKILGIFLGGSRYFPDDVFKTMQRGKGFWGSPKLIISISDDPQALIRQLPSNGDLVKGEFMELFGRSEEFILKYIKFDQNTVLTSS